MLKQYFSNQTKRTKQITSVLVVLIVAGIGTYLLTGSHAATPYASISAGKGTTTCGASVVSDSTASDSNKVRFGSCVGGDEGAINLTLGTGAVTDSFTTCTWNPPPTPCTRSPYISFFQSHFFRAVTFEPYWQTNNGNLSWFPNSWNYRDSYAIYNGNGEVTTWINQHHPEWILHDASGNKLYINFACNNNGSCSQYAADIGNKDFIHFWLTGCDLKGICDNVPIGQGGEEGIIALGYKGVFIDDVNMNMDTSNGTGNPVTPMDSNTGKPMTQLAWSQYMANFMVAIRQALPKNIEIAHNAVWFEGGNGGVTSDNPDPQDLNKEIQSANWIDLERGIVDGGIGSGGGHFGIDSMFKYVDLVHSLCAQDGNGNCISPSVNVMYDSYASDTNADNFPNSSNSASANDIEYNLTGYLLTSNGQDIVSGSGNYMLPPGTSGTINGHPVGPLWLGYSRDLGKVTGARYMSNGLYRRDFAGGLVLLNPPNANPVAYSLSSTTYYEYTSSGQKIKISGSITLNGFQGAVLTTQ